MEAGSRPNAQRSLYRCKLAIPTFAMFKLRGPRLFLALCFYRLLNALLIQTQFDPDEYWQTLEPAYCKAMSGHSCALTWEWTRRHPNGENVTLLEKSLQGPVRSYLSLFPTYLLYLLVQHFHWDSWWVISKGPMMLHAILVAAPTDYAVYSIATTIGAAPMAQWALLFSVGAWFHGYALIRTYSNSIETMLLLVGMALVAPDLVTASSNNNNISVSVLRSSLAFVLGGMSVAIRFTSLAAWVPLGVMLAKKKQHFIPYLIQPCALCGLIGIGVSLLVDKCLFGSWFLPVLGNFQFNVVEGHGALYGTHVWHWYLTAGLPAICGLLLPLLVVSILLPGSNRNRPLWIIIASYTILHSCSAHKEFRFLLPILPLCCIQAASVATSIRNNNQRVLLGRIYMIVNAIAILYLGVIHQAGPIAIQRGLVRHIQQHMPTTRHTSKLPVTVDYLMECHSTPLYSHLHTTSAVELKANYLSCPPSCRVLGDCESDLFRQGPQAFMRSYYWIFMDHNRTECNNVNDNTCFLMFSGRDTPDYIAISSTDERVLQAELQTMNMVPVGRYRHTMTGLRIASIVLGELPQISSRWMDVTYEEMVLYHRHDNFTNSK